jgi:hypothetical protein
MFFRFQKDVGMKLILYSQFQTGIKTWSNCETRNSYSWRYSTAALSTLAHFVPNSKLTAATDEWQDLKEKLKDI